MEESKQRITKASTTSAEQGASASGSGMLAGKRVAVVVFSHYPSDPRPRRAAEALVQQGMQVEVICLKQDEGDLTREVFNGVRIRRLPVKRRRGGKLGYLWQYGSFLLWSFLLVSVRAVLRGYKLVHVHNMPDVLVFSALIAKICGAKVILDLHDPMPELMMTIFGMERESRGVRLLRRLEKWSIRFADLVLTPNIAFQKLFCFRSCGPEKVRVVMNCPDETIFAYRDLAEGTPGRTDQTKPFVVMYHGALVERHGLDVAIGAVERVRRNIPNVELRIFGRSTPFTERMMSMVRERGLENTVRYLGPRSLEEIAKEVDKCDVGVIPNRRSVFTEINLPTRIFEYLARGKAVIAPATTGIRDYFRPEDLVFFEPDDVNDLAQKIELIYSRPEEVAQIVKRGQTIYRSHRWGEERAKFVTLVRDLLKPGGNDPARIVVESVKPINL